MTTFNIDRILSTFCYMQFFIKICYHLSWCFLWNPVKDCRQVSILEVWRVSERVESILQYFESFIGKREMTKGHSTMQTSLVKVNPNLGGRALVLPSVGFPLITRKQ